MFLSSGLLLANESISESDASKISERLSTLSTDQLIERREYLIKALEDDDSAAPQMKMSDSVRRQSRFEISIIEQLLILAGVVILDNITEESPTPPDTVFPIITILGDNPASVELGSIYNDAGATTNEGTISVTSNNVNSNIVGSYSVVYSHD